MTHAQIVTDVLERLNLTSAVAIARVGRVVNERYRWVVSALNLQVSARKTITANTVIGTRTVVLPTATKVFSVFGPTGTRLAEVAYDSLRNQPVGPTPADPQQFAVQLMGANSVTILLDVIPGTIYALTADVEAPMAVMAGGDTPSFSEDFHDLLIYGAMAVELEKMEKYDAAKTQDDRFKERIEGLRVFIGEPAAVKRAP